MAAWSAQWLDGDRNKRRASRSRDQHSLDQWILPALGGKPVAAVTPLDARRLVEQMGATLAPATIARTYSTMRAMFAAAVEADVIGRTPCRGVRLPRVVPTERVMLTPEELERLADAVPPQYRVLILLGGVLGLRWGEATALRIGNISFLRRTVSVAQEVSEVGGVIAIEEPKSKSSIRTMTAPTFLIDELAEHVRLHRWKAGPDELVFVSSRRSPGGTTYGPLYRSFSARTFRPAVARAGLPASLTFHGLRHVAATLMVQSNEHPRVIQHRLGHATCRLSMELYAHAPESADKAAADNLDTLFGGGSGTGVARRTVPGVPAAPQVASDLG